MHSESLYETIPDRSDSKPNTFHLNERLGNAGKNYIDQRPTYWFSIINFWFAHIKLNCGTTCLLSISLLFYKACLSWTFIELVASVTLTIDDLFQTESSLPGHGFFSTPYFWNSRIHFTTTKLSSLIYIILFGSINRLEMFHIFWLIWHQLIFLQWLFFDPILMMIYCCKKGSCHNRWVPECLYTAYISYISY